MKNRPLSVTIICWFIMISNAISILPLMGVFGSEYNALTEEIMSQSPMPVVVQKGFAFTGIAISIICGFYMLQAHNWARMLFVAASVVGLIVGFINAPLKSVLIPGVVLFGVMTYFLYRPNTREYFSNSFDE